VTVARADLDPDAHIVVGDLRARIQHVLRTFADAARRADCNAPAGGAD
jgi:hypothetical protein